MSLDVVVITLDDMFNVDRYRTTFGVEIQTPNFDRLKAMGITFSNANASVALCNPSRTSVLSGQSPVNSGVFSNDQTWHDYVDPATTLPALMHAAGYNTASFGKTFHRGLLPPEVAAQMFDVVGPAVGGETADDLALSHALSYLQGTPAEQSMMMMVGFSDPHGPWHSSQEFLDLYPLDQITVPAWDGNLPSGFMQKMYYLAHDNMTPAYIQPYLAEISEVDAKLGVLLDAIEASGRDPVIILHSDHGFELGDHDVVGKFTLYEQAANVPFVIYHPDLPIEQRGTVQSGVVSLLDIAPTVLELAQQPIPAWMDGHSLLPTVLEGAPTEGVAVTFMLGSVSIRTNEWRYTHYQDGSIELYDIVADPLAKYNLHDDGIHSDGEALMASMMSSYTAAHGITFDDANQMSVFETADGDTSYFTSLPNSLTGVDDLVGIDTIWFGAPGTLPEWAENATVILRAGARVIGNSSANNLTGWTGNDVIWGLDGDDSITGSNGNDRLFGGVGNDTMAGENNNDMLNGMSGNDFLDASLGDDTIYGGVGNDTLIGGQGMDQIRGGNGSDNMIGGRDSDAFIFVGAERGTDVIVDYCAGEDIIRLDGVAISDVEITFLNDVSHIRFGGEHIVLRTTTALTVDDLVFT